MKLLLIVVVLLAGGCLGWTRRVRENFTKGTELGLQGRGIVSHTTKELVKASWGSPADWRAARPPILGSLPRHWEGHYYK